VRPGHNTTRYDNNARTELTLGVLRTLARFAQTDFLTLNFTRIASDVTGCAQGRTQGLVILHQRASDAVTDRAGLTKAAATGNTDTHVELADEINALQRLTHDHARHFTTEILVDGAIVDDDIAAAGFQVHPRSGGFAAAGAVVLGGRHGVLPLDIQGLRLLSGMRMLGACVDFQLSEHGATQRVVGQHAAHSVFECTRGRLDDQLLEADVLDATRELGEGVVNLV